MKNAVLHLGIIVLGFMCTIETKGQSTENRNYLFERPTSAERKTKTLFINPSFGYSQMNGGDASMLNLRTGIQLSKNFGAGLFYGQTINDVRTHAMTSPNFYLDYRTIGGFVEYTLFPDKLVHFNFPIYTGFGEIEVDSDVDEVDFGEANFFLIEPTALVEINLMRRLRFNAGAGYRVMGPFYYRNMNNYNLSGLTGYIGIRIVFTE